MVVISDLAGHWQCAWCGHDNDMTICNMANNRMQSASALKSACDWQTGCSWMNWAHSEPPKKSPSLHYFSFFFNGRKSFPRPLSLNNDTISSLPRMLPLWLIEWRPSDTMVGHPPLPPQASLSPVVACIEIDYRREKRQDFHITTCMKGTNHNLYNHLTMTKGIHWADFVCSNKHYSNYAEALWGVNRLRDKGVIAPQANKQIRQTSAWNTNILFLLSFYIIRYQRLRSGKRSSPPPTPIFSLIHTSHFPHYLPKHLQIPAISQRTREPW